MLKFLLLLLMFPALRAESPEQLFPIPSNMRDTWPSTGLDKNDETALKRALGAKAKSLSAALPGDCDKPQFDWAPTELGKLGQGVVAATISPCNCGRANCAISLFVRKGAGYYEVPFDSRHREPSGWAFGLLESPSGVPDVVIASAAGGLMVGLELYRYVDDRFVLRSSECLKQRNPESPRGWWNQADVIVSHSCE